MMGEPAMNSIVRSAEVCQMISGMVVCVVAEIETVETLN